MSLVPVSLRRLVIRRADGRCEYCGLAQTGQEATFHIDHVVPRQAGGPTSTANLALACVSCSLRKEARRSAADPDTGRMAPFFNPRRQRRARHFRWAGPRIIGMTAAGRATVAALQLNRPLILAVREEESARGRHPPDQG